MTSHPLISRVGDVAQGAAVLAAALGLAFRSVVWAGWVPYPNEPYGVSDILEFLIACLVIALCAICVVIGGILLASRRGGARLLLTGLLVVVAYAVIHPLLPTFRIW